MKRQLITLLMLTLTSALNAQRPTGTFTLGNSVVGPAGFTANSFVVSVPGVSGSGQIAVKEPNEAPVGVILFLSGAAGETGGAMATRQRQRLSWMTYPPVASGSCRSAGLADGFQRPMASPLDSRR